MNVGRGRNHLSVMVFVAFVACQFLADVTEVLAQTGDAPKPAPNVPALLPPAIDADRGSKVAAVGGATTGPGPCVVDRAEIVDVKYRWGIERLLRDLYGKSGITVKLLTVPTTDGEGFIPFVERHAQSWGLAGERNDYGALIVVMPRGPGQSGQVRIHGAYRLQEVLPASWCRRVSQEVIRESFSRGRMSEGSVGMATKVAERLAEAAGVSLSTVAEYARSHEKSAQSEAPTAAPVGPNANASFPKPALPAHWKAWEKCVVRVFGSLNLRHASQITDVAFSPDARFVLSAGDTLLLSDARTGAGVRTFGGGERIAYTRFSADGSLVMAVTHGNPSVFVAWDTATGTEQRRWPLPDFATLVDAAVTLDGKTAVVGLRRVNADKRICVVIKLDAPGVPGGFSLEAPTHVLTVAISSDGSRYAGVAGLAEVRSTESGNPLLRLADATGPIALSPDGKRLAINNNPVQVWDVDRKRRLCSLLAGDAKMLDVAFSADGKRIITGGTDSVIRVWDASTGEPLAILRGHADDVTHVALDSQGKRAVSSGVDRTVRLWNVETRGEDPKIPAHGAPVLSLGYRNDTRAVLSAARHEPLHVWSLDTGQLKDYLENSVRVEGHAVIGPTADAVARVYDDPAGALGFDYVVKVSAMGRGDLPTFSGAHPIAFNASASHIAYRRRHDTIEVAPIWPREDIATVEGLHELHRAHLALSPDAAKLACGDIFGKVTIWSLPSAEIIHRLDAHDKDVSALAFSPNGKRLVSASQAGELKLWDVSSGECLFTEKLPIVPRSLCFTPDGQRLFTGNDGTSIVLWDFGFPE